MKKKAINVAIMTVAGLGLVFTSSIYTNNKTTIEEVIPTQIVEQSTEINVENVNVSLKTVADQTTEKTEETVEEQPTEVTVQYPEWQDTVVANIEDESLMIRQEASTEGTILGKLYPHTVGTIVERGDQWTKIQSGSVTGYVSNDYLLFGDDAGAYITTNFKYVAIANGTNLNVRSEQSAESEKLKTVADGTQLPIVQEMDGWVQVQVDDNTVGYVSKEFVTAKWNYESAISLEEEAAAIEAKRQAQAANTSSNAGTGSQVVPPVTTSAEGLALGQEIAGYAQQFVGNPYVYGQSSLTGGTDCSGFTMSVYAQFGYSLPHSSGAQRGCGVNVPLDQVQPGDIICYSGHVGIYIGGGAIVHAMNEQNGITISNMYYSNVLCARRLVN